MKKILIVEDEATLSNALKQKISKEDFKVEVAKDGQEGLAKLKAEKFDLILLDILMPAMDGLTMLEKLRKSDKNQDIPVIMLSNLEDPALMDQALSLGSLDFLVKSDWPLANIIEKIKERLS